MKTSSKRTREFPALLMTALLVGASLGTTGSLRKMTEQTLHTTQFLPLAVFRLHTQAGHDETRGDGTLSGRRLRFALAKASRVSDVTALGKANDE